MGYLHRWKRLARKWAGSRIVGFLAGLGLALLPLLFLPLGCNQDNRISFASPQTLVRVRLLQGVNQVTIAASRPPYYQTAEHPERKTLNLQPNTPFPFVLSNNAWRVGATTVGSGEMTIIPSGNEDGTVRINGLAYRGRFRLLGVGGDKFDVINDVDVEGYLCGVLAKELYPNFDVETYKAQAIVARTYALYEKYDAASSGRSWDLNCDQSSQVYGGLAAETAKARDAVRDTRGIVVAYGPPGQEHIFKAYFSSCCGGISQSSADAFGEAYIEPLSDQNNHNLCNASPKFNWGPVTIRKEELARRFRKWGAKRDHPLQNIGVIVDVSISATNQYGRPSRFLITDARQNRYSLCSEDFRTAVNTDAGPAANPANPTTISSSFCKVITDADSIRFVEGHGFGHGVGFCQFCAQARAELKWKAEDIVLAAYPKTKLILIPE